MTLSADDRVQIDDLAARYAHGVDACEFDVVGDLFAVDGTLVAPNPPHELGPTRTLTGRPAIVAELQRLDALALTFHGLAGSVVTPTGPDSARGRIKCVAHHVAQAGRDVDDLVWHLIYEDEYVRDAGRWLISRREISIQLIETRVAKRVGTR